MKQSRNLVVLALLFIQTSLFAQLPDLDGLYFESGNKLTVKEVEGKVTFKAKYAKIIYGRDGSGLTVIPTSKQAVEVDMMINGKVVDSKIYPVKTIPQPYISILGKSGERLDNKPWSSIDDVTELTVLVSAEPNFKEMVPEATYVVQNARVFVSGSEPIEFKGAVVKISKPESKSSITLAIDELYLKKYDGSIGKVNLDSKFRIVMVE